MDPQLNVLIITMIFMVILSAVFAYQHKQSPWPKISGIVFTIATIVFGFVWALERIFIGFMWLINHST